MRYQRYYNHRYQYDLIPIRDLTFEMDSKKTSLIHLKMEGRQRFGPQETIVPNSAVA